MREYFVPHKKKVVKMREYIVPENIVRKKFEKCVSILFQKYCMKKVVKNA